MIYSGEYGDGSRVNPDPIMDELNKCIQHLKNRIEDLENELKKVKDETYKDTEIKRMKEELDNIQSERFYGFDISREEYEKINSWKNDWFNRKRGGNHYMGASGGGFTYKFVPTGLGTSGKIIATDGEEFVFQEIG